MLGYPPPYPEELLYSTTARAGVHDGETSPKQLLDKVFNNRKVVATVDLPNHVLALAEQYPLALGLVTKTLISRHTLWPIYASFLPRERNKKLKKWMSGSSRGAVHLASGIAASKVKAKQRLFVCLECLKVQKQKYGECFWNRLWQVPLLKVCPAHGPLHTTSVELDGEHRHSYLPVEEAEILEPVKAAAVDSIFSHQTANLLQVQNEGISFSQWTAFYKWFASSQGCFYGRRVDHSKIHETVIQFWGKRWLANAGILPSETETSWLRGLFRKHRKSFSFAEHIVVISALSNGAISIGDAIDKASRMVINSEKVIQEKEPELITENQLSQDQIKWKQLLEQMPPKASRQQNSALYARLYRNHYDWLIYIDSVYHADYITVNKRVDWPQRDKQVTKELRHAYENLSEDLSAPRLSRTFLIHQLEHRATVEKNLHRLPRSSTLLSIYTESITEYQARRLTRAYFSMQERGQEIKRWSLLRQAGLSDERMTAIVAELLKEMLSEST
ncbi:TnsD family Tn7-like transposition protein [Cycloclasticus zancles]|uniref:Transposon Tn7 transposition protein TnsD n=1 Tax=Cycloclasticus zancles 78-ME TaxID=1198232 RepID=S5TAQ7_9GAMM|nr:TnsD family Tn7-like transposition protein [Cycloclasticus zancles]AGS38561.1 Transposon Tn7 transposition protein TnsD [Cycloclasticus zancles 78-ME]AGS40806.1 Transposon Tn7 transposition protein TnsD [Cycloclasticus zancles 78-ME]